MKYIIIAWQSRKIFQRGFAKILRNLTNAQAMCYAKKQKGGIPPAGARSHQLVHFYERLIHIQSLTIRTKKAARLCFIYKTVVSLKHCPSISLTRSFFRYFNRRRFHHSGFFAFSYPLFASMWRHKEYKPSAPLSFNLLKQWGIFL